MVNNKGSIAGLAILLGIGLLTALSYMWFSDDNIDENIVDGPTPTFLETTSVTANVLTSCKDEHLFTVAPTDDEGYVAIRPLGNVDPPGHTLPTFHVYFMLQRDSSDHNKVLATNIYAPADVKILKIDATTAYDTEPIVTDYRVTFSNCSEVRAYYNHVGELSEILYDTYTASDKECYEHFFDDGRMQSKFCSADVEVEVDSGDLIGKSRSGAGIGAFDMGLFDSRRDPIPYANPDRYIGQSDGFDDFHYACALDYFVPQLKKELYERLGTQDMRRVIEPICGQISEDLPGTAQGNWYIGEANFQQTTEWGKIVSLIHDNIDPRLGVISIGGTVIDPGLLKFEPSSEGSINRDFPVLISGKVYCYQDIGTGFYNRVSGKILIRLNGETKLDVEHQTGSCTEQEQFTSPVQFIR